MISSEPFKIYTNKPLVTYYSRRHKYFFHDQLISCMWISLPCTSWHLIAFPSLEIIPILAWGNPVTSRYLSLVITNNMSAYIYNLDVGILFSITINRNSKRQGVIRGGGRGAISPINCKINGKWYRPTSIGLYHRLYTCVILMLGSGFLFAASTVYWGLCISGWKSRNTVVVILSRLLYKVAVNEVSWGIGTILAPKG